MDNVFFSAVGKYVYGFAINDKTLQLMCSIRKGKKTLSSNIVELAGFAPDIYEEPLLKQRLFPLILSWCVVIVGLALVIPGIWFLAFEDVEKTLWEKLKLAFFILLAGPMPAFYASINYIFNIRKKEQNGSFYFCQSDDLNTIFSIPYTRRNRVKAWEFARKIADICRKNAPAKPQTKNITSFQFENSCAELHTGYLVTCWRNPEKTIAQKVAYSKLSSEILHVKEQHKIRNFFCTALALLFWLPSAGIIIFAAIDSKDWIVISAMFICAILPGVLGIFCWKKRLPAANFYLIQDRFSPPDEYSAYDVVLEVGKNETGAEEFIQALKKHIEDRS